MHHPSQRGGEIITLKGLQLVGCGIIIIRVTVRIKQNVVLFRENKFYMSLHSLLRLLYDPISFVFKL
jgi:hypothetical protein